MLPSIRMYRKNRKGQISIEIMYSVGVLLIIFILLTVMTFSKKVDVERTRDTVEKKNDCNEISSAMNRVLALGDGYEATFKTIFNFDVYTSELIIVGDPDVGDPREIEVTCTFEGEIDQDYTGTGIWRVINEGGMLKMEAVV